MYIRTLARPVTRLAQAGIDLLFPPRCVLCASCADSLPKALPPRCPVCWEPRIGRACRRCEQQTPSFSAIRTTFMFKGNVRNIVHEFKYSFISSLAKPMASLMAETLVESFSQSAVLVPVPLSPRRERTRGYNQAKLLAQELADLTGFPLAGRSLVRKRNTAPQARQDFESRRLNMQDVFRVQPDVLPAGASVVLVDDVITIGATVDACARALRETGVKEIFAIAFARED